MPAVFQAGYGDPYAHSLTNRYALYAQDTSITLDTSAPGSNGSSWANQPVPGAQSQPGGFNALGALLREPLRNGYSAKATDDPNGLRAFTLSAVTQGDFSEKNTKRTVADARRVADLWARLQQHRLEARAAVKNGRGNGALRKMGAVQEGLLRKSFLKDGEYHDQALWTILDEDWKTNTVSSGKEGMILH